MPKSKSWYEFKAASNGKAEVSIYDEIGAWGISAKQFKQDLNALGKITDLTIYFNTPGGSVVDGMAMYNMLKALKVKKIGVVEGMAASMGSFLLTAMDEVHTPRNSLIMIHMPHGPAYGTAEEIEKTVALYRKLQALMVQAYSGMMGLSEEETAALMNAETWYTGEEAVAAGLSHKVLDEIELRASFDLEKLAYFNCSALSNFKPLAAANKTTQETIMSTKIEGQAAGQVSENGGTTTVDPAVAAQAAVDKFKAQEAKRKQDIRTAFGNHAEKHGVLLNECLDNLECSVDQARAKLLDKLGEQAQPQKGGYAQAHVGNGAIVRDSMVASVKARCGLKLADGEMTKDNPFRGMTLVELARASLVEKGVGVASYGDRMQLVGAAFTHSSSDFGNVLADVANKSMLKGYEEAQETFQLWTQTGVLSDFKVNKRVGLNDFKSLRKVQEGAEYKYITIGERGENIVLATYGELFSITRQAVINDDLSAFTRIPRLMGDAARRTIGDLVYAILTDNPTMSDGVALFHANHNNYVTGASTALSVDSLTTARTSMRKQKLDKGKALNIRPEFLIVPAALETTATKLMADTVLPGASNGESNPVSGMAQVISEARLDDASATAWYLAAGSMYDTIEVAYLDGNQNPFMDQMDGWSVDGTSFKVRIDAGVAPLDYRTMYKSKGAA